ncbi:MAG: hypothetical protein HOF85_00300, partial [Acidiferrobacteraceae bacterium]|nr:hypothetical protein [Acidiferrobacteraceae bacterium]
MPQDFDIFGNTWWRFDRYEVSGGYIRPGRGARLEQYKPWAEFRDARAASQRSNTIQRPYSSLFQLADHLENFRQVDDAGKLTALVGVPSNIEVEITQWCQQYGL